jgi:uncharacterized protein YndB with AHSA1/START domain
MSNPTFIYVTYIATTLEQLWDAIASDTFIQQYLGEESEHKRETLQADAPHELSYHVQFFDHTQPSRVRFLLEPAGGQVKLTVIHDRLTAQSYLQISHSATLCLSLLKELETAIALVA